MSRTSFVPGKTYRVCIIILSIHAMFHIYVDEHEMEIIKIDDIVVERTPVLFHLRCCQANGEHYVRVQRRVHMANHSPDCLVILVCGIQQNIKRELEPWGLNIFLTLVIVRILFN